MTSPFFEFATSWKNSCSAAEARRGWASWPAVCGREMSPAGNGLAAVALGGAQTRIRRSCQSEHFALGGEPDTDQIDQRSRIRAPRHCAAVQAGIRQQSVAATRSCIWFFFGLIRCSLCNKTAVYQSGSLPFRSVLPFFAIAFRSILQPVKGPKFLIAQRCDAAISCIVVF